MISQLLVNAFWEQGRVLGQVGQGYQAWLRLLQAQSLAEQKTLSVSETAQGAIRVAKEAELPTVNQCMALFDQGLPILHLDAPSRAWYSNLCKLAMAHEWNIPLMGM